MSDLNVMENTSILLRQLSHSMIREPSDIERDQCLICLCVIVISWEIFLHPFRT